MGEHLQRADGTLTQVTRITPRRGPPVEVFNLEIDAEHVYHVGDGGVLVHNTYVYTEEINDVLRYVGITDDYARRAKEWARSGRLIQPIAKGLTRTEARELEEAILWIYGRTRQGGLANQIRSISITNPNYSLHLQNGLKRLGDLVDAGQFAF